MTFAVCGQSCPGHTNALKGLHGYQHEYVRSRDEREKAYRKERRMSYGHALARGCVLWISILAGIGTKCCLVQTLSENAVAALLGYRRRHI
jgi:hypothetical protein